MTMRAWMVVIFCYRIRYTWWISFDTCVDVRETCCTVLRNAMRSMRLKVKRLCATSPIFCSS